MFCNLTGPDQIGPTQNDDRIVPFEKESKFTDGGNYKQCDMWKPRVIPLGDSHFATTILDALGVNISRSKGVSKMVK